VKIFEKELQDAKNVEQKSEELILAAKDVLFEWLDGELSSTVTEMSVFSALAKR
jgi:hypothetical protein